MPRSLTGEKQTIQKEVPSVLSTPLAFLLTDTSDKNNSRNILSQIKKTDQYRATTRTDIAACTA
jgi:hypothetical protein